MAHADELLTLSRWLPLSTSREVGGREEGGSILFSPLKGGFCGLVLVWYLEPTAHPSDSEWGNCWVWALSQTGITVLRMCY